jgi:glyoxylase-like metal-dependent hydrolase (beta-lactamase superfamily II)
MGAKGAKCNTSVAVNSFNESRTSRNSRMSCGDIMKQILPGIWQWSWFSDEKQLDFNGLFLMVGEHKILVDPPPMTAEAHSFVSRNGPVDYIILTNRDHMREAAAFQAEFACRLYAPDADAARIDVKPTKTYKDGELLPGGIWAIQLSHQKSPGESALFLERGQGIMIVGDALIGKPAGAVSLLPAEKYPDAAKVNDGLRRLLKYNFDSLLVGDGASILAGGKPAVERLLSVSS